MGGPKTEFLDKQLRYWYCIWISFSLWRCYLWGTPLNKWHPLLDVQRWVQSRSISLKISTKKGCLNLIWLPLDSRHSHKCSIFLSLVTAIIWSVTPTSDWCIPWLWHVSLIYLSQRETKDTHVVNTCILDFICIGCYFCVYSSNFRANIHSTWSPLFSIATFVTVLLLRMIMQEPIPDLR
jgi:hypothetical protein